MSLTTTEAERFLFLKVPARESALDLTLKLPAWIQYSEPELEAAGLLTAGGTTAAGFGAVGTTTVFTTVVVVVGLIGAGAAGVGGIGAFDSWGGRLMVVGLDLGGSETGATLVWVFLSSP
jgi:hypothetical protein